MRSLIRHVSIRDHLVRAGIYLLIFLSPVGAPIIGMLIVEMCGNDSTVQPDGPFAMGLSYCGVSRPVEHLYQNFIVLTFIPGLYVGQLVGWLLAVTWWCLGIAVAAGCIWHLWRAFAQKTIERL